MHRKSIRRDDVEAAFEELLMQMVPNRNLLKIAAVIFKDIWNMQASKAQDMLDLLSKQIGRIEKDITGLVDRIMDSSQSRVITAYEERIDRLERKKLMLTEKLANAPVKERPFEVMFELAMQFLTNPYNCLLYTSPSPRDRG